MNTSQHTTNKLIGVLLITGAIALLVPYTMLINMFSYPDILRQDTASILKAFHQGGSKLIWTWFAFALTGLPLLPAYILMGDNLKEKSSLVNVATFFGVIGLIVQMIGLLRWTFVVPVLADTYVHATDEATRAATIVAFKTIHQFAGVLLGEHVGQFFTIIWTVMISVALQQSKAIPTWVSYFAYAASGIYILAQAELFATVIPSFPTWEAAGFVGSSLWLLWMIILGVCYLRFDKSSLILITSID